MNNVIPMHKPVVTPYMTLDLNPTVHALLAMQFTNGLKQIITVSSLNKKQCELYIEGLNPVIKELEEEYADLWQDAKERRDQPDFDRKLHNKENNEVTAEMTFHENLRTAMRIRLSML